jgi:hypothetical protein
LYKGKIEKRSMESFGIGYSDQRMKKSQRERRSNMLGGG